MSRRIQRDGRCTERGFIGITTPRFVKEGVRLSVFVFVPFRKRVLFPARAGTKNRRCLCGLHMLDGIVPYPVRE